LQRHTRIQKFYAFESSLLWLGFEKVETKNSSCEYRHPHFIRGQRSNLTLVKPKMPPRAITRSNHEKEVEAIISVSVEKKHEGRKFPRITPKDEKCKTTKPRRNEKNDAVSKIPCRDAVRISSPSSESETQLASPEKENENLRVATSSFAVSPVCNPSTTEILNEPREKTPPGKDKSPDPPTERELFPLSIVNTPKRTKRSIKQHQNHLDGNGTLLGSKDPEHKLSSKRSPGRLRSRGASRDKNRNKKRKVVPKSALLTGLIPRNGLGSTPPKNSEKPNENKGNNKVPENIEQSISGRTRKRKTNHVRDTSQERSSEEPAAGRGLRSSNKLVVLTVKHLIPKS